MVLDYDVKMGLGKYKEDTDVIYHTIIFDSSNVFITNIIVFPLTNIILTNDIVLTNNNPQH